MRPPAILFLLGALAWQTLAMPFYRIGAVGPDFVLVAVGYLGLRARPRPAILAAVVAGIALDLLSIEPLGVHVLAYLVAVSILVAGRRTLSELGPLPGAAFVVVALASGTLFRLATTWSPGAPAASRELLFVALGGVYTGALSILAFAALDPWRGRLVGDLRAAWGGSRRGP